MTCRTKRKLAALQAGLLDEREAAAIRGHVQTCPVCQAELAALARATQMLQAAPRVDPPHDLWPAIQGRLTPRSRRTRHHPVAWRPALAAAMVLVVLIGGLWLLPALQHQAPLPLAPAGDADTFAQVQLAAAWDSPLADQAALGLAMLATMDEGQQQETTN
jgi:predicted anti-sigma-YlaC factor YlaD